MQLNGSPLLKLYADQRGLALLEFALGAPLVLALGLYGLEIANQILVHMTLSQMAISVADNTARVGTFNGTNIETFRESDINDVLNAARSQGGKVNIGGSGRIIVSSLENVKQSYDSSVTQRIHWQRCIGMKSGAGYDSSYGQTSSTDGTTDDSSTAGIAAPDGMGDPGARVSSPEGAGLIFVEVNYLYKPLISFGLFKDIRMHYTASMIVRNNRDFRQIAQIANSNQRASCNLYRS